MACRRVQEEPILSGMRAVLREALAVIVRENNLKTRDLSAKWSEVVGDVDGVCFAPAVSPRG